jgi:type I restriction enzyme M protein
MDQSPFCAKVGWRPRWQNSLVRLLRKLISFGRTRKTCGGDFKHTDFGKIILPFTLLRRLECALESTREASLDSQPATIEFLEAEFSVDFDALLS